MMSLKLYERFIGKTYNKKPKYLLIKGRKNMKKFLKVSLYVLLAIFILGAMVFGYFSITGYQMYQDKIKESSIEERVNEIRSDEDYVTIDEIPVQFQNAVIAVEDHRFKSHGAVDFISIGRAIVRNISEFRLVEGGSTITQQLAKNMLFTQETTFTRKMAEIFAAIDLEKIYSKDEILELYVNTNYYGDGYYGIGAASRGYFDKEPMDLTLDEITLLAGLPNAPSAYSPTTAPELAKQRQLHVIYAMEAYGYLSEEEANALK